MREIPPTLTCGPFTREHALAAGVTPRMLRGRRFVRLYPRVWCLRDHPMGHHDRIHAAALALPQQARPTGITRIQLLGLDHGPRRPLHFVVEGELHLSWGEVFVHRTVTMPPTDDDGVTPAGAFIAYCAEARLIDAIKVGDWLLHHGHMTLDELTALALAQLWRLGADEALLVSHHLDARARSLPESEVRALLSLAGLPPCVPNAPVRLSARLTVLADLWFERWRTVVEYEGGQHQTDRGQYVADIDRFRLMRGNDVAYVQVTAERLRNPRLMVRDVHRTLVSRGFDGQPPEFGAAWDQLFVRVRRLLGASVDDRLRRRR